MEQLQFTYGRCRYNLDSICQCQEYTLNSDRQNECLLCKHNKGWHERHERHTNYPSHLTKPTNLTTSTNYKVLETIKYMSLCINRIISVLIKNIFFHFQRAQ